MTQQPTPTTSMEDLLHLALAVVGILLVGLGAGFLVQYFGPPAQPFYGGFPTGFFGGIIIATGMALILHSKRER